MWAQVQSEGGLGSHAGTGVWRSWFVGHMPFALQGYSHPLGSVQLSRCVPRRKVTYRGIKDSAPSSSAPYSGLKPDCCKFSVTPTLLQNPVSPWRNPCNTKQECWGKYARHKANQKKVRRNITDVIYYLQGKNQNARNFYICTPHDIFQMNLGL